MKKVFYVAFLFASLPLFLFSKNKQEINCRHQTAPFMVDGINTEWGSGAYHFDSKTGFAYVLSNDTHNLYIQLKMTDKNVQRKALLTGFTVWIDPNGKGKHVLGIIFPQGRVNRKEAGRLAPQGHSQFSRQHNRRPMSGKLSSEQIRMFNEHFSHQEPAFKGFDAKTGVSESGIAVKLQMDSLGQVVYEAKIPLKCIFRAPSGYLSDGKPFSLTFETGYLQMDMSRMQGHGGGGRGMQNGGMGSGHYPGPSRMAMMQGMAEPTRLKLKTVTLFQIK